MTRRITVRSGAVPRKVIPPASAAVIAIETTFLVAASNARPDIIAVADFVCDGTDDDEEINAAVAALNALGLDTGRVQLSEGTFSCTDLIIMDDHVLQGVGEFATEIIFDDGAGYSTSNGAIDVGDGGIFDLEVTVWVNVAPTPLCAIILDPLSMMHNVAVYFGPTDPDNTAQAAVRCDRGTIVNCFITADFDTAGGAAIRAINTVTNEAGLISHNLILCGPSQRSKYGVYLEGDGWTVVGNKIDRALLDGIYVPSAGSKHVIVGNNITRVGRDGVRIDGTDGLCLITGNIIDLPGVDGIHLTANTTNNVIGTNLVIGAGGVDILDDGTNTTLSIAGAIPVKTDTGDPGSPFEGQIYANTFDKKVRVYADAAWRDLATW